MIGGGIQQESKMKRNFLLITLFLALTLLIPSTLVSANSSPSTFLAETTNYKGTVSDISATSLTLTLDNGTFVTIQITSTTKIPSNGFATPDPTTLFGKRVTVKTKTDSLDALVATSISFIPGLPTTLQRVGTVSDYVAGKSITIEVNGSHFKYFISSSTKILPSDSEDQLATGISVTIISPRVISGLGLTASGIILHLPEATEEPTLTATPKH
jgi:hypothetical protein